MSASLPERSSNSNVAEVVSSASQEVAEMLGTGAQPVERQRVIDRVEDSSRKKI